MTTLNYANHCGYSDVTPYEVVRVVSDKTIEVREMKAERGEWKPDFRVMGFAARVVNQNDQHWTITVDETAPVERIRLNKKGEWRNERGQFKLSDTPVKFYDFNF